MAERFVMVSPIFTEKHLEEVNVDTLTPGDRQILARSGLPGAKDLLSADPEKAQAAAVAMTRAILGLPPRRG
jgi:hypothetical protein